MSGDFDPDKPLRFHSSLWLDFYDSRDNLKTSGIEVTQAIFQPSLRVSPVSGLSGHVSYVRWPQLLRREFSPFVNQQIVGNKTLRGGMGAWHEIGNSTRISGRIDHWRDQTQSTGTNWETRIAQGDLWFDQTQAAITVYYADGVFTSGPGTRLSYGGNLPWCHYSLVYDVASYKIGNRSSSMGINVARSRLLQQSLLTNLDFSFSKGRSVNVVVDCRFGGDQDSLQSGLFFHKRI